MKETYSDCLIAIDIEKEKALKSCTKLLNSRETQGKGKHRNNHKIKQHNTHKTKQKIPSKPHPTPTHETTGEIMYMVFL